MDDIKNNILSFLALGYKIDIILKELNIKEENLADIILELEEDEFIILENKNWMLTMKGKDKLKGIKEDLLKKLKIDYLHGNIDKNEFLKKRKELESIEKHEEKIEEKNLNCHKCGKENKAGSKYCYKCGELLNIIR